MPKVIYEEEDNSLKDALEMGKLGMGIGNNIRQGRVLDIQEQQAQIGLEESQAKFNEWNSPEQKSMRSAQTAANTETAKATTAEQFDKRRIQAGTALAQMEDELFGEKTDRAIPLQNRITSYSDQINKLSGGDINIQTVPKTLEDGTQVNVARYVTKSGEALGEFQFTNDQDFRKQAAELRQSYGYVPQSMIDNFNHVQKRVEAFRQLPASARALVGNDPNRMDENPDVAYMVENMIGGKKSHADYADDREDQTLQRNESNLRQDATRLGMDATRLGMSKTAQDIRFAAEDQGRENELHPYHISAAQSNAQSGKLDVYKKADPVIEDLDPSLTPEWVDVSGSVDASMVDPSDPLYQIDQKSGKVMKAVYSSEQEAKKRDIIVAREQIMGAVPDIDPVQATEKAVDAVNKKAEAERRRREKMRDTEQYEDERKKRARTAYTKALGIKRFSQPYDTMQP